MRDYPEVITPAVLAKNAHISDAEIAQDIADTEREMANYERVMVAEREMAAAHPDPMERRMADFKAGARPHQIEERQRFVDFLRRLQVARAETVPLVAMQRSPSGDTP